MIGTGFVILRHVNSPITDAYWRESLRRIRHHYPTNRIVIIDDNSSYPVEEEDSFVYEVVKSKDEYVGSAELLPYIFYNKYKWFESAVFLQDSTFLNSFLSFRHIQDFEFLWSFENTWNNAPLETELLGRLKFAQRLHSYYWNDRLWRGAFGAMGCFELKAVELVNERFELERLVPLVKSRPERMAFERIISVLFSEAFGVNKAARFGNLHAYCAYGTVSWENFHIQTHLPVIKVWTFR